MELTVTESQRSRSLQLVCSIIVNEEYRGPENSTQSPTYDVGQMAMVYFQFERYQSFNVTATVSVKRHGALKHQHVEVTVNCSNKVLQLNCTDDWTQHSIGKFRPNSKYSYINLYVLKINIVAYIIAKPAFKLLYGDNDFTDFTIGTEKSSIRVHKSVLSATSEVFKTMLNGEWKGTDKGCLDVNGVTQKTLEYLKKYMYNGELPKQEDLLPLLLIAKRYEIGPLEQTCSDKLAQTVKGERLMDLLEFAVENNQMELIFSVFEITPDLAVDTCWEAECKKATKKATVAKFTEHLFEFFSCMFTFLISNFIPELLPATSSA